MNDSRIQRAIILADNASLLLDELLDELDESRERNLLAGANQFLRSAIEMARKADVCGAMSCMGSVCVLPAGHDEPHESQYGVGWTAESDARSAAHVAASMKGRRD